MTNVILDAYESTPLVWSSHQTLEEMIADLLAQVQAMSQVDITVIGGYHDFSDMNIRSLDMGGFNAYVSAETIENVEMTGSFGYLNTDELVKSADIAGDYNGVFARDAVGVTITIDDANSASFYSYDFEDGVVSVHDSVATNIYTTDADSASYGFSNSDDSYVRIEGNGVEVQSWFSSFDTLQLRGEDANVNLVYSQVNDFEVGRWGEVDLFRSFVNGEVGFGTEVSATSSEVILELAGNNDVTITRGQALIDAQNGYVDHFVFKDGAQVDGQFDGFDEFQMASGAIWTADKLTSQYDSGETAYVDAGQFELGAIVFDDYYMYG